MFTSSRQSRGIGSGGAPSWARKRRGPMNVSSRLGRLGRIWRTGIIVVMVSTLAFGALVAIGQRRSSFGAGGSASTGPQNINVTVPGPSATPGTRAAATSAPQPTGIAVAPASGVASSGSVNRAANGSTSSDATILNAPLPPSPGDQKIIRTATIQLTAKDVAATQNAVWSLASELGGNVLTSNTSGTDDSVRAEVSFRVPSDRYKEAIDRLHGYAVQVQR